MGAIYFFHFPRNGSICEDKYSKLGSAERFVSMIKKGGIEGNRNKGFFHKKVLMPLSVSFSAADIAYLHPFIKQRSSYSLVFLRANPRLSRAKEVKYMTRSEMSSTLRRGGFRENEMPFIDLKRESGEETAGVEGSSYWMPRYDFSWETEYRLLCGEFVFEKGDIHFATVKNSADSKAVNDKLGLEALELDDFQPKIGKLHEEAMKNTKKRFVYETLFEKIYHEHKKEGTFVMKAVKEDFFERARSRLEEIAKKNS